MDGRQKPRKESPSLSQGCLPLSQVVATCAPWLKFSPSSPVSGPMSHWAAPTVAPGPARQPHSQTLVILPCSCVSPRHHSGFLLLLASGLHTLFGCSALPIPGLLLNYLPLFSLLERTSSATDDLFPLPDSSTMEKNHYNMTILPVSLLSAIINIPLSTAIENRQFSYSWH